MSQFRDTFTKEEKKEPLLDYDDSAFLFFSGTILLVILTPWTYLFLFNLFQRKSLHSKKFPFNSEKGSIQKYCQCSACITKIEAAKLELEGWRSRLSLSTVIQFLLLLVLWSLFLFLCASLKDMKAIQNFDPFEILELPSSASVKEIKKAYRVMSLKYHPDKNAHDPTAAAKFMLISKAYQALTDEIAKMNFQKYGNPDGPGVMKVGIGLPRFLVEEDFQLLILILFFLILLVLIPMVFMCYYQNQKKYAPNGVQIDTLHLLSYHIQESTRCKNCPEFLAASAESREIPIRSKDDEDIAALVDEVVEPKKLPKQHPTVTKSYMLILGHMQRLHHLLSPSLLEDLNTILIKSTRITHSMVEIATLRDWIYTAESMLEFRRDLLQALDIRESSLIQIPHFDAELLKHCHRGRNAVRELSDFIRQSPEERKGLTKMNQQQLADVQAFCAHVSDMLLKAHVQVDDEKEICKGDIATCHVQLTRQNLQEGEAIGPIHAPLFPDFKQEEWWIFLSDKNEKRILGFCRCRCPERQVEERIQFGVSRAGKHVLSVHAMCDSYAGVDVHVSVEFKAYAESEINREVYVHPEDEALDNEPTLFQQMLGQMEMVDSSDEEEVDEAEASVDQRQSGEQVKKKKKKAPHSTVPTPSATGSTSDTSDRRTERTEVMAEEVEEEEEEEEEEED